MAPAAGVDESAWVSRRGNLLYALRTVFGHHDLRGKQEEAMREVMSGNDALVVMPTGGGKSLCYQLPAVVSDGVCVVVSPLIALTEDQLRGLRQRGVKAASFTSAASSRALAKTVMADLAQAGRGRGDTETKLLYVTPEMLAQNTRLGSVLEALSKRKLVSLLAIDEAHCVSSWGHDFRPAYRQLGEFRKSRLPGVPCLALTATATSAVCDDILQQMDMKNARLLKTSFNRANIHLSVRFKDAMDEGALKDLVGFLKQRRGQSGVVYCHKRVTAESLAQSLNKALHDDDSSERFLAMPYHGRMSDADRSETQAKFMSGEVDVITGSVAFGMGIDKSDVRFVIHWDLPKSVEGLYQELGRAGRDGQPAVSIVYHSLESAGLLGFLAKKGQPVAAGGFTAREQPERTKKNAARALRAVQAVQAVIDYCEKPRCRRGAVLAHFGEKIAGSATLVSPVKHKRSSNTSSSNGKDPSRASEQSAKGPDTGTGAIGHESENAPAVEATSSNACRGTCDWCDGSRKRVENDLLKLASARAGRGWGGVQNISSPRKGRGGRGGGGEDDNSWDAGSYYRLAGYEGNSGGEDSEAAGSSGDEFGGETRFDPRGPGAAGGEAVPPPAEVSMTKFVKEEDYWERLERLEAEAEGKSSAKSLQSSLLGNKKMGINKPKLTVTPRKSPASSSKPSIRSLQPHYAPRSKQSGSAAPARSSGSTSIGNYRSPDGNSCQAAPFASSPSSAAKTTRRDLTPTPPDGSTMKDSAQMPTSFSRNQRTAGPLSPYRKTLPRQRSSSSQRSCSYNLVASSQSESPDCSSSAQFLSRVESGSGGNQADSVKDLLAEMLGNSKSTPRGSDKGSKKNASSKSEIRSGTAEFPPPPGERRTKGTLLMRRDSGLTGRAIGSMGSNVCGRLSGGLISRPLKMARVGDSSSPSSGPVAIGRGEDDANIRRPLSFLRFGGASALEDNDSGGGGKSKGSRGAD